jgi:dynactin complex subunit
LICNQNRNFADKPKNVLSWQVGDRCEVDLGAKRGEVMFVGKECKGLPAGYWVGVKYDEPVGKNDGR